MALYVQSDNAILGDVLSATLKKNAFDLVSDRSQADIVMAVTADQITITQDAAVMKIFTPPVRLGAVLQYLTQQKLQTGHIDIGDFSFDAVAQHLVYTPQNSLIDLTEKEVAIIECLLAHDPDPVPRHHLLEKVWGYASTAETHTVETHIYRLRQKIDKAVPDITFIETKEAGYLLMK